MNHSVKRRRKRRIRIGRVLISGVLILGMIAGAPVLWHIKEIRSAQDRYDFQALADELNWVDHTIPWLKKIPLVRDSAYWLKLNLGQYEGLEEKLAQYPDDRHRFWLLQIFLVKGEEDQARSLIQEFQTNPYRALAEGLFAAKQGDNLLAGEKIRGIADSDLRYEEKILKYLSLARLEMAQGNYEKANAEWEKANNLAPDYPLVKITKLDLDLAQGEWERAKDLEEELKDIPGYDGRPDFLIKKALLASATQERDVWDEVWSKLGELENGSSYQEYLQGVESYQQGRFSEAQTHWQKSLAQGLPEPFLKDVKLALEQTQERLDSEGALTVIKKNS